MAERSRTLAEFAALDLADIGELYPLARELIEPGPTSDHRVVTAEQLAEAGAELAVDRAYQVWLQRQGLTPPAVHGVPVRLGVVVLVEEAEWRLLLLADRLRTQMGAGELGAGELRGAGWVDHGDRLRARLGELHAMQLVVDARHTAGAISDRAWRDASLTLADAAARISVRLATPPPTMGHVFEACRHWLTNALFALGEEQLRRAGREIGRVRRLLRQATGEARVATVPLPGATCPDCGTRGSLRAAIEDPDRVRWFIACQRRDCPSDPWPWAEWERLSDLLGVDVYAALADEQTAGANRPACTIEGGCGTIGCNGHGRITERY